MVVGEGGKDRRPLPLYTPMLADKQINHFNTIPTNWNPWMIEMIAIPSFHTAKAYLTLTTEVKVFLGEQKSIPSTAEGKYYVEPLISTETFRTFC